MPQSTARPHAGLPRGVLILNLMALLLLLALAFLPASAEAQLGGLTRKMKDKVAGPRTEKPAADRPARPAAPTLTPAMVDQLIAGLKAERQTLDDARSRVQAGQQQVKDAQTARTQAWLAKQQKYSECTDEKLERDPKQPQRDSLQQAADLAEYKGQKQQAEALNARLQKLEGEIQARAESACAQYQTDEKDLLAAYTPTESEKNQPDEYATMRAAGNTAIVRGAAAAGMSQVQYGQVKEAVVAHLRSPSRAGLTPAEAAAVDARRDELAPLLKAVGA